jgi:hypothetical protein
MALLLLAACTDSAPVAAPSAPVSPLPPPAFVAAPPNEALPAMVAAERQASIAGNLALLAQLWATDARIIDGRHAPTPEDDYIWSGRPAILDRYELAVFPSPPPPLPADAFVEAQIHVNGDQASLEREGDLWRFIFRDGRWWLLELRYN